MKLSPPDPSRSTPLQNLMEYSRELYALRSATALLSWDQETYMPPKAGEGRARSMAALSRVAHQRYSHPRLAELLAECSADASLEFAGKALVRELQRDRNRTLKVPETLAAEIAETASLAQRVWAEARPKNDTAAFNPWLEKMIGLRRQEAECLGYEDSPYDALLENYEPGARAKDLKPLFEGLRRELVPLLGKIVEASRGAADSSAGPFSDPFKSQVFPAPAQRQFNQRILAEMGFDLEAGRLDESAHPFTEGLYPRDVRLTTRYSETDLMSALFGTLHEGGHGLYEQGFPEAYYGTPLAEAVSLGIHESQSRLWENQVGRSEGFWSHYYPSLQAQFPGPLGGLSLEDFLKAINKVEPSCIRVEADEVTYNLHIALRFELELALFGGELKAADLEGAWNEGMRRNLGITPPTPAAGYLQDVHWSCGLLGYFPTYTLGSLRAAQLFAAAEKGMPGLKGDIRAGRFAGLKEWLTDKVYRHGRAFSGDELMEAATGSKTSAEPFLAYLKAKYSSLFGFAV